MLYRTSRRFLHLLFVLLLAACGAPSSSTLPAATNTSAAAPASTSTSAAIQTAAPPSGTPISASALTCPDVAGGIPGPIVFISENNLISLREDGSESRQITATPMDVYTHDPFWSPDGQTLTLMWTLFGANPQNIQETTVQVQLVCGIDRSTGKGRVLARRENVREFFDTASWTPDGKQLLVTLVPLTGDTNLSSLARFDPATGTLEPMLEKARTGVLSPDQSQLAYLELLPQTEGVSMTLMLAQADGKQQRTAIEIDPPFTYMSAPSWSADGRQILFTGAGGPISIPPKQSSWRSLAEYVLGISVAYAHSIDADLWIMDVDSQKLRQLTTGLDDPRSAWSPDNRRLVYTGNKKGGVYILDIESGKTQQISELGLSSGITWASR